MDYTGVTLLAILPLCDYFIASTSTAIDNFTEENQQNSRLLDQFPADSEELELSSDDSSYSLSDDDCELFYGDDSSDDETLDVQPPHHNRNVDEERSSTTLTNGSSNDPLYAFPTTSGTFNSTLTKSETCASILAYSLKHCSTYSAMQDLLELIDLIIPSPNRLPKSVFSVKRALTPDDLRLRVMTSCYANAHAVTELGHE